MADESAQLAAVVNTKFKLDWVEDPVEKFRLITMLKKRSIASTKRVDGDGGLHPTESSVSFTTAPAVPAMGDEGRDFSRWPLAVCVLPRACCCSRSSRCIYRVHARQASIYKRYVRPASHQISGHLQSVYAM